MSVSQQDRDITRFTVKSRLWSSVALPLGVGVLLMQSPVCAQEVAASADVVGSYAAAAEVDEVVVSGARGAATAMLDLATVPGGTSVVDSAVVDKGRVFTNQDLLAFQPGVFAQSAGGADGIKISIRGSAINRGANFFRTGVLLMFDGLPVNGPGGAP